MNLVTGGTGIVGSHIAIYLLQEGERVRLLVRNESDRTAIEQLLKFYHLKDENLEYVTGDINDPISLRDAVAGCQHVFHCAAKVSFKPGEGRMMHVVNTMGTANLVDVCLEHSLSLAYLSSTAAIGDQKVDEYYIEDSIWTSDRGRSAYAISKRYAELEVFRGIQEGLKATIVNPGIIIGPGNWGKSSTSIFLAASNGMRFYPTGSNGFVDARDVAEITIKLSRSDKAGGRHLLIGENLSFKEVFTLSARAFGKRIPGNKIPRSVSRILETPLKVLEFFRINPLSVTSENLKSAYRKSNYSNDKIKRLGFKLRPIEDAMAYTKKVFDMNGV